MQTDDTQHATPDSPGGEAHQAETIPFPGHFRAPPATLGTDATAARNPDDATTRLDATLAALNRALAEQRERTPSPFSARSRGNSFFIFCRYLFQGRSVATPAWTLAPEACPPVHQPTESAMIPFLAAASAIDTIATGAASALQHLTSSAQSAGKKTAAGSDFAALLGVHGFGAAGPAQLAAACSTVGARPA